MKIGLVLEGGAKRGIFTAGILDVFMENKLNFQYVIGVSAGAGNALNYTSGQIGRTKYVILPEKKYEYIGFSSLLKSGKYVNLDRMLYEFSKKQYPFDFDAYFKASCETEYVAVNCETGKAEYFSSIRDKEKLLSVNKASCSVPILCKPVEIDGYHYLDGSVGDAIPFQRAFDRGCDKVIAVLTRPEGESGTDYSRFKHILSVMYKKKYPELYELLMHRLNNYNNQIKAMNASVEQGKMLVIRPSEMRISRFERDRDTLDSFYAYGRSVAEKLLPEIVDFIGTSELDIDSIAPDKENDKK